MRVEDFDYHLPEELIAQTPLLERSSSRLLVMNRTDGALSHHHFTDIIDLIPKNSIMVLNNTKVLPSRIYGKKTETNANIELLLLKEKDGYWEALVKPARRVKPGTTINFNDHLLATIVAKYDDGFCHVKFTYEGIFLEQLEKLGEMPLPPYIHQKLEDQNRYQTVYATMLGSAAAPTAGLHFTQELLAKLQEKGVTICYVTLHIGLGTFRAVTSETVENHQMHSEHYFMSQEVADILNEAKAKGKTIISVGTTSTRTLESIYQRYHQFVEVSEDTDIFIYPGYQFQAVDQLITNFHLPKSTLIMLVSAFSKLEYVKHAYQVAIDHKYRFFSFGDAMYIK